MVKVTSILRYFSIIPWAVVFASIIQLGLWGADRETPFTLNNYRTTAAEPGGTAFIGADVDRVLPRGCSAEFSRHMIDIRGYRYELSATQMMSAEAISDMDRRAPGKLLLTVAVPPSVAPGEATLITVLNYECNPVHKVFPIRQVLNMKFEVLKP